MNHEELTQQWSHMKSSIGNRAMFQTVRSPELLWQSCMWSNIEVHGLHILINLRSNSKSTCLNEISRLPLTFLAATIQFTAEHTSFTRREITKSKSISSKVFLRLVREALAAKAMVYYSGTLSSLENRCFRHQ